MTAGWMTDGRSGTTVRRRATRLAAAGLIGVAGMLAQASPAAALVGCSYADETATLTLHKRDGLTIGRSDTGTMSVTDRAGAVVPCEGLDPATDTVMSVNVVADAVDNDSEQVTLDMTNGRFVYETGQPVHFSIDLGGREPDSLVVEGMDDIADPDHITVSGTGVDLYGDGSADVVTTGVERVEVRGNGGDDVIDAQESSFGAGQTTALAASSASPGVTLVGGDGDDTLTGGTGDDMLIGNRGDDTPTGMLGDDWLDTGPGAGTLPDLLLAGGGGSDTADFSGMFVPVEANLGEGVAAYAEGGSGVQEVENLVGTSFADLLVGDEGGNAIDCAGGDDEAYGMGGRDRLRGASGDDLLNGTGGGDSLDGGDGDDTLHGGGSGDGIGGGSGSDTIHSGGSGSGQDAVNSETGSDVIYGGPGRQVILAGDGLDEVYGEAGNDVVDGQDGEDMVFGGSGNDTARGGDGPDQVYGGTGSNIVDGGAGDDEVYGGTGVGGRSSSGSSVDGGAGDDAVFGGGSSDQLTGADGDDVLSAGGGDDLLKGQAGDDVLRGAEGTDTVSFTDSRFGVTASLTGGSASGDGEDALSGIENLWGSRFADSLAGDHFRNELRGGAGADVLAGGLGADQESGEGGNDALDEGRRPNGGDRLSGGAGSRDVVDYSARSHLVRVTRNGRGNDGERGEHDNILRDIDRVRR